jgi:hypothetical protein
MTNDERAAIRARCDAIGRRYATVDEQCSHVGEADAAVWTVSADPYEAGWETDSGYPGYGLLRSEAEFYAAAPATLLAALDELDRLTPAWSADTPTRPGWYWFRDEPGDEPDVVEVFVVDARLRVFDGAEVVDAAEWGGEWAGPIPPPA